MTPVSFEDFDALDPAHLSAVVSLWNAACGSELAITERGARFNTQPVSGGRVAGRFALVAGQRVAVILASAGGGYLPAGAPDLGYVEALAVEPSWQRHGLGSALLGWAEDWLAYQGCMRFRSGGGLRPFAPGLPAELGTTTFFAGHGYQGSDRFTWDLAADLAHYRSPAGPATAATTVRRAEPGEEDILLAFFEREFPDRWRFEYEEALRHGSRIGDYILLVTDHGINGFAHMTFEDSYWPLDRVFPHRLPHPWGQVGPLGVSAGLRGRGLGAALMHGTLSHLRAHGVRGCVVDWTTKLDFYARFGFAPHRKYVMLVKEEILSHDRGH